MAKAKYTKGKDGYFQTKVWDGTYVNGVKHRIPMRSSKSSRDLELKVIEHNQKIKEREFVRKVDITFEDYAKQWKIIYKGGLSINTNAMYDNIIEKHLSSVQCNIGEVNRMHYMLAINATKGNRTKQQIDMTFKQIVKSGIKDKVLPASAYEDIFADTTPIKYKAPEKRALLKHEKKALFQADLKDDDKAFVFILYGCGLRRGEALALTRFDISLERRELSVNKAIAFDCNNPCLKEPKTANSTRTVPIPDIVYPIIENYIRNLRGTILFPNGKGYKTKSSYIKMWDRIVRTMQGKTIEPIEGLTAHIFRHNFCANLCYKIPTISIGKIAELLGDSEKMVIEVYNHIIREKENAHEVVSKALNF